MEQQSSLPGPREEPFPELQAKDMPLGEFLLLLAERLSFCAWPNDHCKERCGLRGTDPISIESYEEEGDIVWSSLIEPCNCLDVLRSREFRDPHGNLRFEICEVSEDFPEVIVVGSLKLILDDHSISILIFSDQIHLKRANLDLTLRLS